MSTVRMVNPRALFRPERFDLAVKLRFFRSLVSTSPDPDAERLYRDHIAARTGGVEPRSPKLTVDAYVAAARALAASIARDGVGHRTDDPIVIGNDRLPRGGAHRIACAVALGIDRIPVVDHERRGCRWDLDEIAAAWTEADRLRLLRDWTVASTGSALFVLWPVAIADWARMEQLIGERLATVATEDIVMPHWTALGSLVQDLYGLTPALGAITDKIRWLRRAPPRLRVVVAWSRDRAAATEAKRAVREAIAARNGPHARHNVVHAADGRAEVEYQADVLLSAVGRAHAARRTRILPDRQLQGWLVALRQAMAARGVSPEEIMVVGGSAIAAAGLRRTRDVDLIGERAGLLVGSHGVPVDAIASRQYLRGIATADLIADPARSYRRFGLKIAGLDVVLERLQQANNPRAGDLALLIGELRA